MDNPQGEVQGEAAGEEPRRTELHFQRVLWLRVCCSIPHPTNPTLRYFAIANRTASDRGPIAFGLPIQVSVPGEKWLQCSFCTQDRYRLQKQMPDTRNRLGLRL